MREVKIGSKYIGKKGNPIYNPTFAYGTKRTKIASKTLTRSIREIMNNAMTKKG